MSILSIYRLALAALAVSAVAGATACAAYAQDATGGQGSIFTPPSSGSEQPGFSQKGFHKRGKAGGFGRGGGKGRHGNHVGWHQIQMLPSLTFNQRKEIKTIYQQAKAEIQPDVQQIKEMKGQFKGRGPDGLSPENKEKFSAIKSRLVAKRESVWQQVKTKLTAQQLEELEKMRAGQLKPPAVDDTRGG